MSASLPIAVADTLVGAAVPQAGRLRFAAADPRLRALNYEVFDSTAAAARRLAEAMLAAREPGPRGGRAAGGALLALLQGRGR